MSDLNIYITIILMSVLTYATREVPFALLGERKLSERWIKLLSFVPVSVMSALLVPELLFKKVGDERLLFISFENLSLISAILTFIIGYYCRNFFITIISGMGILALLRYIFN